MWTVATSPNCHRITPEPTDESSPNYVQDDSGSGSPALAVPVSTKSTNVAENINGVMGLESHKTSTDDGKTPSGEHLAVSRQPSRTSEPCVT
jgi:hypothetical protein